MKYSYFLPPGTWGKSTELAGARDRHQQKTAGIFLLFRELTKFLRNTFKNVLVAMF